MEPSQTPITTDRRVTAKSALAIFVPLFALTVGVTAVVLDATNLGGGWRLVSLLAVVAALLGVASWRLVLIRTWTMARKLWLSFGLLVMVLSVSGFVSCWSIQRIVQDLEHATEVRQPLEVAILELKTNASRTARRVLDYVRYRREEDVNELRDAQADFERSAAEFDRLAQTDDVRRLGHEVTDHYQELTRRGGEIVTSADQRHGQLQLFREHVGKLERLIDQKVPQTIDHSASDVVKRLEATLEIELIIDQAFAAIGGYILEADPALRQEILDEAAAFKRCLTMYRKTRRSAAEEDLLHEIDEGFAEAMKIGIQLIATSDHLHAALQQLDDDLRQIDRILDDQIQPVIHRQFVHADENVKRSGTIALTVTVVMALLALVIVGGATWFTTRGVVRSVARLVEGARQIGRGNLDHHIAVSTTDELSLVAGAFNKMAQSRQRAEQELARRETLYRTLVQNLKQSVFLKDLDSRFVSANSSFCDSLGVELRDVVGKTDYDFFPPELAQKYTADDRRVIETGEPLGLVEEHETKDGRIWVEVVKTPVKDDAGNVSGVLVIFWDVTERKRAEEHLAGLARLRQDLLRPGTLSEKLQRVTEGVVEVFDADFARIWLIKPGDRCERGCMHAQVAEGPHVCQYRERCLHLVASSGRYTHLDGEAHQRVPFGCYKIGRVAAGEERKFITNDVAHDPRVHDHQWARSLGLVSFAGYRLLSPDGQPTGVLALFAKHPLSPAEDSLLESVADTAAQMILVSRAEEKQQALEVRSRQQQKLESIGTLAGGVAHEINNPIQGIMNYAQLIGDKVEPDSPAAEHASEIVHETKRVATIVRNLLAFARQEKQTHSPASIADIINATVSLIRTIIRRDQIKLEVEIPEDLPRIKCRSQQIQQVLMNLLTNARDALNERYPEYDPDKIVTVTAGLFEKDGRPWIRTTVEDHGIGINEKIRNRLFDPFFTTKDRTIGTGLGLSISHGIVQDHRGELTVESEPGQYTRVHLDLPVDNGWTLEGSS